MKLSAALGFGIPTALIVVAVVAPLYAKHNSKESQFLGSAENNATELIDQGRQIFRFDTYGDEAFWTGQLHMEQVVPQLSPRLALGLGLKVDSDAVSPSVVEAVKHGRINLNDPAVTLALVKQNAVLGVVGTFNNGKLEKGGVHLCALSFSGGQFCRTGNRQAYRRTGES